jgi:hypothetical protein
MPMTLPLAGLYADADATLYTAFLALDPVLGFDATASLNATAGARPRRRYLP